MVNIASWNVNSIRARLPQTLEWLSAAKPDILLMQELKCEDSAFPREPFEDLGYNIALAGQKTYNGVAILSKQPLEDVRIGLPGNEDDVQARYIEAVTGKLRVASVYVPNGMAIDSDKYHYKLAFYNHLSCYLSSLFLADEAFILGGDFNVAPYVQDGYNPAAFHQEKILCSQREREALRRLLHQGYVDALRALHPQDDQLFTWWDYRQNAWPHNQGYRIDHFLLNPRAADLLKDAGVDTGPRGQDRPSDHAPIWINMI